MRRLRLQLASFAHYDIRGLPAERYVIFVIATTGDGEPPPDMLKAWRFLLRTDLPANSL